MCRFKAQILHAVIVGARVAPYAGKSFHGIGNVFFVSCKFKKLKICHLRLYFLEFARCSGKKYDIVSANFAGIVAGK
jgi:hypothetical protein